MVRTAESPASPRVSPPDLPDDLTTAEPRRNADLLAARLDLTGTIDLAHSSLEQCVIAADVDALDLTGATILDVALRDLRVDYLNLGGAKARDIVIADSAIRTLDLPQAELTRVRFENSRSDEVDPRGLRAKDVDLRGLDAMSFTDANSLRGVTLTTFQVQQLAPVIAAGLGIQISD